MIRPAAGSGDLETRIVVVAVGLEPKRNLAIGGAQCGNPHRLPVALACPTPELLSPLRLGCRQGRCGPCEPFLCARPARTARIHAGPSRRVDQRSVIARARLIGIHGHELIPRIAIDQQQICECALLHHSKFAGIGIDQPRINPDSATVVWRWRRMTARSIVMWTDNCNVPTAGHLKIP